MLRVGIDATILAIPKAPTGVYRYTASLVRELAHLAAQEDLHLSLYFAHPVPAAMSAPGLPLADVLPGASVRWRTAPLSSGWRRVGMGLMMLADRLDLFHFTSPLIARFCPVPMVVTIHDIATLSIEEEASERELSALPGMREAARRARKIIAVSRSAGDEVKAHFHVAPAVVHEAVDSVKFHPSKRDPGAVGALLDDSPYVLCVGTLHTRKNHLRLLRAWEVIQDEVPHVLALVGDDGTGSGEIAAFLAAHPHLRVKRIGYVPESLIPALYAGADAVALVSLWEGFGLPLLEAMASGAPVITSNTSSLAEVSGEAALLVDPRSVDDIANGLRRILTDSALRTHLRAAGSARVAQFTWQQTARETLAVYRQVSRL